MIIERLPHELHEFLLQELQLLHPIKLSVFLLVFSTSNKSKRKFVLFAMSTSPFSSEGVERIDNNNINSTSLLKFIIPPKYLLFIYYATKLFFVMISLKIRLIIQYYCKLNLNFKNQGDSMIAPITHLSPYDAEIIKSNMPSSTTCNNLAIFYSIFSDSTRLKIIIALLLSEMCVNDLSTLLNINQTTVSHQLKVLKSSGAVTSIRKNKYIFYKVDDRFINNIMINGVDFILNKK